MNEQRQHSAAEGVVVVMPTLRVVLLSVAVVVR